MKQKIVYYLSGLFLLSACSLDIGLPSYLSDSNFYKTESDAIAAVNGMYSILGEKEYYKEDWTVALNLSADDLLNGVSTGIYQLYGHKQYNAASTQMDKAWKCMYRSINSANLFLLKEPEIRMAETVRKRLVGEAKFIRALNYFNLVRCWGEVPVSLEPTQDASILNKPKQPVDSIYNVIIADLSAAVDSLPLKNELDITDRGRASKGAAQSLLALVYLTKEDWKKAYENAQAVIVSTQYKLVDDYDQLWNVSKESMNYDEIIFAVQHTRDFTNSSASSAGSSLPPIFCPNSPGYTGHPGSNATNIGRGFGQIKVQQWFYDRCLSSTGTSISNPDYRVEKSFITQFIRPAGTTANVYPTAGWKSETNPYIAKFIDPDGLDQRNHENDFIILRFSEVLLIKAEAGNELRDENPSYLVEAYNAFNDVRARARKANGVTRTYPQNLPDGLDKHSFRMAVFDERGLELIAEGHRWFDLVRMKYKDTGKTMYDYILGEYLPSQGWKEPVLYTPSVKYEDYRKLFPIPNSEITSNNITQNNGY